MAAVTTSWICFGKPAKAVNVGQAAWCRSTESCFAQDAQDDMYSEILGSLPELDA